MGYILYQNNRNAPCSYLREEYTKMIKKRLAKLLSVQHDIKDKQIAEKATLLVDKANNLLKELNENY